MADYDGTPYAIPSVVVNNFSAITPYQSYPNPNQFIPHQNLNLNPNLNIPNQNSHYHGVDIDTATIVSIASSCIILISGCIAVVCLIMYMKKTDMLYRSRTCAKCGAHVTTTTASTASMAGVGTVSIHEVENNLNLTTGTPISIRSEGRPDRAEHVAKIINYQLAAKSQQNLNKQQPELDSIVIYRGLAPSNQNNQNMKPNDNLNALPALFNTDQPTQQQQQQQQSNSSGLVGCLDFFEQAFKNESKTSFMDNNDDDEAAPYATFNLPGFESDSKISDTYETFAAKFSEPPYMLLKKGIECPPQYADSIVDCKLGLMDNDKTMLATINDPIYQSAMLSQYHSIASCSSNQDELIRAYEYGKEQKQKLLKLQNEAIQQLAANGGHPDQDNCEQISDQDVVYRSMMASDHESPTDPGIREFTKSPPKPNEKRQGIVFHHQPTVADILKISKHMIDPNNNKDFTAKTSGNPEEDFKHELSSNETTNSFSSIKASTGSGNGGGNGEGGGVVDGGIGGGGDSTPPSVVSELGSQDEDAASTPPSSSTAATSSSSSSSSTATPDNHQAPPPPSSVLAGNETNKIKNFGAISRDRSRNPSWATFTTMKCNMVLATPSTSQTTTTTTTVNNDEVQSERAFVTFNQNLDGMNVFAGGGGGGDHSSIQPDSSSDEDQNQKHRSIMNDFKQSFNNYLLGPCSTATAKATEAMGEHDYESTLAHSKAYYVNDDDNGDGCGGKIRPILTATNPNNNHEDLVYNKLSFNNNKNLPKNLNGASTTTSALPSSTATAATMSVVVGQQANTAANNNNSIVASKVNYNGNGGQHQHQQQQPPPQHHSHHQHHARLLQHQPEQKMIIINPNNNNNNNNQFKGMANIGGGGGAGGSSPKNPQKSKNMIMASEIDC